MKEPVIRTILAIHEKEKSMTFASDILERGYARLMKANYNQLVKKAMKVGFAAYISKPLNVQKFMVTVDRFLKPENLSITDSTS